MQALEALARDLRYGARQLRQSPSFTVVAVLSLALGIGANTAMFQLVDAVRLRTLPVRAPWELVSIDFPRGSMRSGWFSTRSARLTYAQWEQIRTRQQAFSGVLAWSATQFNLAEGGEARHAEGLYVSGEFFEHLGIAPLFGRTFTAHDDNLACASPGAVISHAFWQREFGGAQDVLGRTLKLDNQPFPVIGVTPPSFFGVEVGHRYDVAIPLCADRLLSEDGKGRIPLAHAWWLAAMGRLKPGWTIERANAHLQALSPSIMQATLPPEYRADSAQKYLANKLAATSSGTGVSDLRREYERPLWLLLAITGLVLLIACANLANLLLARGGARQREIAVRVAMGASRARIVRQLLAESLLLALSGAALGTVLAQALSRGLVSRLGTANSQVFLGLEPDWRVLGFTSTLALTTCILFGLMPALRVTRVAPVTAMRSGGRGATAGRERHGLRRALVATQVALSLVLLAGALLFVRSLRNLLTVDPGFRPDAVVAVSLDLRQPQYPKERRIGVYRDLLDRLSARRGIVSAAQVLMTPVSGSGWNSKVRVDGSPAAAKNSFFNRIGRGYFRTMGTPLVAGRDFDDRDTLQAPRVAIVNQEFARQFFGGENPVGRTFRVEAGAGKPDPVYEVAGLVKNTKYYELREDPVPIAFFPTAQDDDPSLSATFVLRTSVPPGEAMAQAKSAVAEVSPAIGLEFRWLSAQIQESLLRDRLMAALSAGFGLLAGVLATLGLYGVIAYMVARRRNEIGVRIALGSGRAGVIRLVLREAALQVALGLAAGVAIALAAGRAAASMLFGLKPHDPVTLAAAAVLLAGVALAAAYGPARSAAGLDPMAALRDE